MGYAWAFIFGVTFGALGVYVVTYQVIKWKIGHDPDLTPEQRQKLQEGLEEIRLDFLNPFR